MASNPLSDAEVLRQIRDLVARDLIVWGPHVEERMAKRGLDKYQAKECLLKGHFEEKPTVPNRTGPIEYTFRLRHRMEGQVIKVAASLFPQQDVFVITVMRAETQR